MMPWALLGILLAVCAVLCAVGFYKFVYFLSLGYGFAVAGGGIAILVMYLLNPTAVPLWLVIIQAALFVAYGVRLSGFLLVRELKNASFKKTDVAKSTLAKNKDKKMPIFVLAVIWIFVSILYVAQVSPMLFRYSNAKEDIVVPLVGVGISVIGLVLESVADIQKSAQKKARPDMVATKGLYKIVRCPNYFGEIVFWTGVFVAGVTAYAGVGQWLTAILAYVSIVYIMFNGAQRLEKRQSARYGTNEEYLSYVSSTPIIIPLLPIYHLNKPTETKSEESGAKKGE
jgi:steroid 5-alpha reductase family enzyme